MVLLNLQCTSIDKWRHNQPESAHVWLMMAIKGVEEHLVYSCRGVIARLGYRSMGYRGRLIWMD